MNTSKTPGGVRSALQMAAAVLLWLLWACGAMPLPAVALEPADGDRLSLGAFLWEREENGRAMVFVAGVVPNSPAHKAGLLAGDLIATVNGKHLKNRDVLDEQVQKTTPGVTVVLSIVRDAGKNRRPIQSRIAIKPRTLRQIYAGAFMVDRDTMHNLERFKLRSQPTEIKGNEIHPMVVRSKNHAFLALQISTAGSEWIFMSMVEAKAGDKLVVVNLDRSSVIRQYGTRWTWEWATVVASEGAAYELFDGIRTGAITKVRFTGKDLYREYEVTSECRLAMQIVRNAMDLELFTSLPAADADDEKAPLQMEK